MQYQISRSKIDQFIKTLNGKIFNVCWTKQTGELRCANVRTSVRKGVKGTGKSGVNNNNSYIVVYLMWNMDGQTFKAEKGHRYLNIDTIEYISVNGIHYTVIPEAIVEFHDTTTTAKAS